MKTMRKDNKALLTCTEDVYDFIGNVCGYTLMYYL